MRVAIRVDATERIGGGHAMRCLTLANALRRQGAETLFVSAALPASIGGLLAADGHALQMIVPPSGLDRDGDDWHEPPLLDEAQLADAAATLARLDGSADWMVVDHYLLSKPWHSAVRCRVGRVMVIDDLANRRLDCDLLLDQTFRRTAADYRDLVPAAANVLAGAPYALLRPEFPRERPAALERRKPTPRVERILISLGTTDIGGITAQVSDAVLSETPNCAIDVVLSEEAPSMARVREIASCNPRVRLHIGTNDMAKLMRDADLAIGAAGTTSWERCCLGLPSLTLVLAGNQAGVASGLAEAGVSITVEWPEEIGERLRAIFAAPDELASMSAAAFALVDGLGAERVVETILGRRKASEGPVRLRPAIAADSQRLWLWRNDPQTRMASLSSDPIPWREHDRWLHDVLADPKRHLLIAERRDSAIGMVRFDPADGAYDVSINIRPAARGEGVGGMILEAACQQFSLAHEGPLHAIVLRHNQASRRLFEKCGFEDCGGFGDRGYHRYVRHESVETAGRPRSVE